MTTYPDDPKGLMREAYLIEGITAPECRSIFLDWALSLPAGSVDADAIRSVLSRYSVEFPDHPMTATLQEGLGQPHAARRRGGRASRVPND
jgi:hypothetical protein